MTTEHIAKGLDRFLQSEFASSPLNGTEQKFVNLRTKLQRVWDKEKKSKSSSLDVAIGFLEKTEEIFSARVTKAKKDADKEKRKHTKDNFLKRARETLSQLDRALLAKIDLVKVFDECLSAELKASPSVGGSPHFAMLEQGWKLTKNKSEGEPELSLMELGARFFMLTHTTLVVKQKIPVEAASAFLSKVREKLVQHDPALYFKIDVLYAVKNIQSFLGTLWIEQDNLQQAVEKIKELCVNSGDDIPALYAKIQAVNDKSTEVKDLFIKLSSINEIYKKQTAPKISASESVSATPTPYDMTSTTVIQTHPRAITSPSAKRGTAVFFKAIKAVGGVVVKGLDFVEQGAEEIKDAVVELKEVAVELKDKIKKSPDSSPKSSSASASSQTSQTNSRVSDSQSSLSSLSADGSPTGGSLQGSPKRLSPAVAAQVVEPKIDEEEAAKDILIGELKDMLAQELKDERNVVAGLKLQITEKVEQLSGLEKLKGKKQAENQALTQTIGIEKESILGKVETAIQDKKVRLSKDFRFAFRTSNVEKLDAVFVALSAEQFDAKCRESAENVVKGLLGSVLSRLPGFLGGNYFKRRLDARVDAAVDYLQDRKSQEEMRKGQNALAIRSAAGSFFAKVNIGGLVQHLNERDANDVEIQRLNETMQPLTERKGEHEALLKKTEDKLLLLLHIKSNWGGIAERLSSDPDKYAEIAQVWASKDIHRKWNAVQPLLLRLFQKPEPKKLVAAPAQSSSFRPGQTVCQ